MLEDRKPDLTKKNRQTERLPAGWVWGDENGKRL